MGLIRKRMRTERGQREADIHYRPSIFGEVALTEGVYELIRGEEYIQEYES